MYFCQTSLNYNYVDIKGVIIFFPNLYNLGSSINCPNYWLRYPIICRDFLDKKDKDFQSFKLELIF